MTSKTLLTLTLAVFLLFTATQAKLEHQSLSVEEMAAQEKKEAEEQDAVNAEWQKNWEALKAKHYSDPAALHTQAQVLPVAFEHMIASDLLAFTVLLEKKEDRTRRLNKEEIETVNNGLVTLWYIEAFFAGKKTITSTEAITLLDDGKYTEWIDANSNDIAKKIDDAMGKHINHPDNLEEDDDEDDEDDDDDDDEDDDEDDEDEVPTGDRLAEDVSESRERVDGKDADL